MQTPEIDIPALGRLARLDFTPEEKERYASQLPKVVEYVGQLQAVQTDVVATSIAPVPMRADIIEPSPSREEILAIAPEREGDFMKVKAVF